MDDIRTEGGWLAVWHGLFRDGHPALLKLPGLGMFVTLLEVASMRGTWAPDGCTFDTSLKELQRLCGSKRETIRSQLQRHEGRYWELSDGDGARPLRIHLLKAKRAGKGPNPDTNVADAGPLEGSDNGPPTRLGENRPSRTTTSGGADNGPPAAWPRWQTERINRKMRMLKFNARTQERILRRCAGLPPDRVYTVIADSEPKDRPGGFAWSLLKRMLESRQP